MNHASPPSLISRRTFASQRQSADSSNGWPVLAQARSQPIAGSDTSVRLTTGDRNTIG